MKIINIKDVPKEELNIPLFTGKIVRQSPVKDIEGSDLSIDYIHFTEGVRNKFHTHSNDQVLLVTRGRGIVATEEGEFEVTEGDIIYAPAGEKHRHGAQPGFEFTHISITKAGTKLTQLEK